MSLKAFHLIFITACCVLALGCGVFGLRAYWAPNGQSRDLVFGLGGFAATAALIVYELYFLRKLKRLKMTESEGAEVGYND